MTNMDLQHGWIAPPNRNVSHPPDPHKTPAYLPQPPQNPSYAPIAPGYPPNPQNAPGYPSNPQNVPGYPPPHQFQSPPQQQFLSPLQQSLQSPPPVTHQPFESPPPVTNCPPGLEYLTQIRQLHMKQKVEVFEAIVGFERQNQYNVQDSLGNALYSAKEDTDCCTRNFCGPGRPFDIVVKDHQDRHVIHLNRPLRCQSCFFPCFLQKLDVSSPPGTIVGTVEQEWSVIKPRFCICDQDGNVVLKIVGPICTWSNCGADVEFKVTSADETTELGRISKRWSGLIKEAFTEADNFGISFPRDLDIRCKATLLGAAFLIDYMYFQTTI